MNIALPLHEVPVPDTPTITEPGLSRLPAEWFGYSMEEWVILLGMILLVSGLVTKLLKGNTPNE